MAGAALRYRVENRKLVIDEKSAAHVRCIFPASSRSSALNCARGCTRGIRTPRGNRIDKKYLY